MAAWQQPENFALWLLIIFTFLMALVTILILFTRLYFTRILTEKEKLQDTIIQHQEQLLQDSILVQERERTRIAADLHDVLISKLNISLLTLNTTQDQVTTSSLLQKSIQVARQISHDLSPPLLEKSGLLELIDDFLLPLKDSYSIQLQKQSNHSLPLNPKIKLQVFRICQEVLNNIFKHAQATQIKVKVLFEDSFLKVRISDNGRGFDPNNIDRGLGFKNIALRSEILGGNYAFQPVSPQGTSFIFQVSLSQNETAEIVNYD